MKDHAKKAVVRTKKFVSDHQIAIAVTATALVCLKLNKMALRDHEAFMAEHGILEKFYTPVDEDVSE
jgi:hypothetical protein